jgi:hypothetical protein
MLARLSLCILTLVFAATAAGAADLAVQSRLGAVFAEPAPRVRVAPPPAVVTVVDVPWMATSPRIPGYYGRWGDFYYTSYYGTDPGLIFGRLPYACHYYASC